MKQTNDKQGKNLRSKTPGKTYKPSTGKTTRGGAPSDTPRGKNLSEKKARNEEALPALGKAKPAFTARRDSAGRSYSDKTGTKGRATSQRSVSGQKSNVRSQERFSERGTPGSSKSSFGKPASYRRSAEGRLGPFRKTEDQSVRLNKFIANAGVCARREADILIQNGAISVNGQIITQMGYKVNPGDVVLFGDQRLINEQKVYLLLNKPKDYITTVDDPQKRKTVLDLIRNACRERVFPVGRLDRNTTGLLLLTNDGELAKKLTHPKHRVRKIYHAELDKPLTKADMEKIAHGIKLDEGTLVKPDDIAYVEHSDSKKEIGIDLHSGQNRVVRRIFEQLGYKVTRLDRVVFAGLTKKDLPRGKWRFLTEKEVHFLKMLG